MAVGAPIGNFSAAISARQMGCGHLSMRASAARKKEDGQWKQAMALPFIVGNPSMGAGRTVEAKQAMALLHKMRESGMAASVISFNSAISACEMGGQWEQPWVLLVKMRETDMLADVSSFSLAISACREED